MKHPAYGVVRPVCPVASALLENNPSEMTLEGTNTWLLRDPRSNETVVVDPGYADSVHRDALLAAVPAEQIALILLTHHHPDHAEGAPWLAERTGAPVRAFAAELCQDAPAIVDGERIAAAGLRIDVLHTPGHTADSVSLRIDDDAATYVLTGDTILGRGTTILEDLGDYLRTLPKLAALPANTLGLPGHGPELPNLAETAREYAAHREQRLNQIRDALAVLGQHATPRQIVEHVYADTPATLWPAAEQSVRAQLTYLNAE